MDANRQEPYQLADDQQWVKLGAPPQLEYDRTRRVLRLASNRHDPGWFEDPATAAALVETAPESVDRFGTHARWDAATARVLAAGAFDDEVAIFTPPAGRTVTDVAIGFDDVLYLALGAGVVLKDLRARWESVTLAMPATFQAWRLAPRPTGGVYWLDRAAHAIGRVDGLPLRSRTGGAYAPGTFRPTVENPDPPRASVIVPATWPADEGEIAIACSPEGRLALLTWKTGAAAQLRLLGDDNRFMPPTALNGVTAPYSLAWVGPDRIAVMIARSDTGATPEAPVFPVSEGATIVDPVGDFYPLTGQLAGAPFMHGVSSPPPVRTASGTRPLHHISWPSFTRTGTAVNARAIDSGEPHTIWHRLYLEASLPPGCGARVLLATTDDLRAPGDDDAWHEHRFGAVPGDPSIDVPQAAWVRTPSEMPFAPSLLACDAKPGRTGLWTALIQRAGYRVRTLVGRYLWVRLDLFGDGRTTPDVAALRAYGGRRSYVQNYLPSLYHESVFGPDADAHGDPDGGARVASTGADFLERFVGAFESMLTPIEDRIASSWLLTDPDSVPDDAIEWLASWIGFTFAAVLPADRQRAMLAGAMELYRRRGTLRGLGLALDLATGGSVARGEIVIFEDFRLRRTFATILGADFADEEDPLLPGLLVSGNSLVGDTLFLGDEQDKEFLALFAADLPTSPAEQQAIADLFEKLAHRATVLVHNELDDQDLGIIRNIVDREAPAHVAVQVLTASQRFLVGMSSLVGIDTFLATKPASQPVRVDVSSIGVRDMITHLPSLDPRLGDSPSGPATTP